MRVYLGLGTNLGDKESNLHVAVRKINERIGEVCHGPAGGDCIGCGASGIGKKAGGALNL